MPAPHPVEFRRRAVELARTGDKPVAVLAKDLGISASKDPACCAPSSTRAADVLSDGTISPGAAIICD